MGGLGQYADVSYGYFTFPKLDGEIKPRMMFNGKEVLVWSINNYLGLANHPDVRKADAEAAARWGLAYPMGSRMLTGNSNLHEELESQLFQFLGREDAFLLNIGYQGMSSIIQALTDMKDVILFDKLAHASILDGLQLSSATHFLYRHNDIDHLERRLKEASAIVDTTGGGILVVTEGVYGMKGDIGKLDRITRLKHQYNFRILVDDAHGFGVLGDHGIGTTEHFGVQDSVDLLFSTFTKSMAIMGAFVSGSKKVIQHLKYNLRSQIYSRTLPAAYVEGAIKRLELLRNHQELRRSLWQITDLLQSGLKGLGFDIGGTESPITPVYLEGGIETAGELVVDLRENFGIFVSVVTYPVVEKGEILLRIIPTAGHRPEDVDYTLRALEAIRSKYPFRRPNGSA